MDASDKTKTDLLLFVQQLAFFLIPVIIIYSALAGWYIILCAAVMVAGVLVWGIFDIRLALFVPVVNRLKTKDKIVVLTFDDGPTDRTNEILSVLKKEQIQAVFFFIGKKADEHADILKTIAQTGHSVGVHTQNHSLKFTFSDTEIVKREIEESIATVERITGQNVSLFRPPFGIMNPIIAKSVRDLNLTAVGWTIRSLDSRATNPEQLINRILKRLSPGAIILLHDIPITAQIVQELITEIRRKGYGFKKI
jgi:peptidoglycan/xylan/chitin deacetylase (PgdA/CDA1 family)